MWLIYSAYVLLRNITNTNIRTSCYVLFSPIRQEGWTKGGADELLNAVLVRRREVQPPPARIELVEARSKVGDVFQAKCLQGHRTGGAGSFIYCTSYS